MVGGGTGPATASLDVGATPGTDVYAPVDGTIVGITPLILDGKHYGATIEMREQTAWPTQASLPVPFGSLTVPAT